MKRKNNRKGQTNRAKYLSSVAFAELKEALEAALAFERGNRAGVECNANQSLWTAELNLFEDARN